MSFLKYIDKIELLLVFSSTVLMSYSSFKMFDAVNNQMYILFPIWYIIAVINFRNLVKSIDKILDRCKF